MTPREPDRFDAQARELLREIHHQPDEGDVPRLAAALRAAESSALDAAEAAFRKWGSTTKDTRDVFQVLIDVRRALIPPADENAAETGKAEGAEAEDRACDKALIEGLSRNRETWIARAEKAEARVAELEAALGWVLSVDALLAASAAPPEGEGKP